jgi:hypothetical protein
LICEGEEALPLSPVGADGGFVSFWAVPGCCSALQEEPNGRQVGVDPLLAPLSAVSDPPPQPEKLTTAIRSATSIAHRPPNFADLIYRISCFFLGDVPEHTPTDVSEHHKSLQRWLGQTSCAGALQQNQDELPASSVPKCSRYTTRCGASA